MLSDAKCKAASSEGRGIRKLVDAGGLYLWVFADGRKYWRFRYWYNGREKELACGVYPAISLKVARVKRDAARALLDEGLDPLAERKSGKAREQTAAANSFKAVALEWRQKQNWSEKHAQDVDRRLSANIFPALGSRPVGAIDAAELLGVIRKIEARGAHDLSHRVLALCGQIFRYAIATQRARHNPAPDLRGALTANEQRHQAAIKPDELPALLQAISGYDAIGDTATRLALELLALTFVRTNELIGMEWTEIAGDVWTVPAARMKGEKGRKQAHVVPLSRQALTILAELKPLAGGSRFVFPGRNRDKSISNNTMLFALYRLGYKGKMTGHGFRAVASTALNEMGHRPDVIEAQLAHREKNEVRAAYNRALYLNERALMMQQWADYLDAARKEK